MPISVQVLFDRPQQEIASMIRHRLAACQSASIVCGFATVEGMRALMRPLAANSSKLQTLVVGAGTYRAYEAFDELVAAGVQLKNLFVHLGHTRPTGPNAQHRFYRYHPMLHSKVYLMEMPDGTASAFIGSHNITGFALLGLNGEASVLLEGESKSPEFDAIRKHIAEARNQATPYTPGMKEAYSWWTTQFVDGLRGKVNDQPRDGEGVKTIVILGVRAEDPLPKKGDLIYFELPVALGTIQSLRAEVHIYIFENKPSSPGEGLGMLGEARQSLWCKTAGLEMQQGGVELRADWFVEDRLSPTLRKAPRPFRPAPTAGMQQVRVEVLNEVFDSFEYLFHTEKTTWMPVFDQNAVVAAPSDDCDMLASLKLVPPEDREWFLVRSLRGAEATGSQAYKAALEEASPDSGSYILMSLRRRKI